MPAVVLRCVKWELMVVLTGSSCVWRLGLDT